jgi:hypothetical protein
MTKAKTPALLNSAAKPKDTSSAKDTSSDMRITIDTMIIANK